MQAVIVFAALISIVLCGPAQQRQEDLENEGANMKYFLVDKGNGIYEIEDLVNGTVETRATEEDLTYYFYSRSNPTSGVAIQTSDIDSIRNIDFSTSRDSLFIIHGWRMTFDSELTTEIADAVFSRYDINVIAVDWGPIAAGSYISAQGNVGEVGNLLASFIRSLESTYGLDVTRVAVVGFSLGGHVAGVAGSALDGQLNHIIGLDPAGPLFTIANSNNRLDAEDAWYVQVIHTNAGVLGISISIGDSDYFPNGGSSQPGCGLDLAGGCSHARSYQYYAEAIRFLL